MQTEQIVSLLVAERDRLNRAIEALQGGARRRGRPPGSASTATGVRKRRPRTAEQRRAHSERMKAYWAARRKQKSSK